MLIDSHAHIYAKEFEDDLEDILNRCKANKIYKVCMPNIDRTSIDDMLEVEAKNSDMCFAMMGLHPSSVKKDFEKELYIVEEWLAKRRFIAVGEIGIDLYWDKSYIKEQIEAFRTQIGLAKKYRIPIAIHCREAFNETISIVEEMNDSTLSGVFHCFTGTKEEAKRITDAGFYLGIGGVVTFKNGGLDKVIPDLPLENIVLETDSPYLAPAPYRGKRNEPGYLNIVAQRVAEIKETSLEEIAETTSKNAEILFNIGSD